MPPTRVVVDRPHSVSAPGTITGGIASPAARFTAFPPCSVINSRVRSQIRHGSNGRKTSETRPKKGGGGRVIRFSPRSRSFRVYRRRVRRPTSLRCARGARRAYDRGLTVTIILIIHGGPSPAATCSLFQPANSKMTYPGSRLRHSSKQSIDKTMPESA